MAAKSFMSRRKTVVLITDCSDAPARASTAERLRSTRSVCAATSPSTSSPVAGSSGIWPAVKTSPAWTIAWLYGPMAAGASGLCTRVRSAIAPRREGLAGLQGGDVAGHGVAQLVRADRGDARLRHLDAGGVVGEHRRLAQRRAGGEADRHAGGDRVAG